ncbi:hypothetical protein EMPS_03597 [Entomortierella parvispora]|uniref:Arm-like repeat domain-containing protein n=1 Tax=Entomortierella parvispora TaxID=205924 RepID=A0A9P3H727_9FUNG|nr:hypothetical protein EMPS_03597 [Entomortierella parvispora]
MMLLSGKPGAAQASASVSLQPVVFPVTVQGRYNGASSTIDVSARSTKFSTPPAAAETEPTKDASSSTACCSKSNLLNTELPVNPKQNHDAASLSTAVRVQDRMSTESRPATAHSPHRGTIISSLTAADSLVMQRKQFSIPVPVEDELIEDTVQLVYCARLLDKALLEAISSLPLASSTNLSSTTHGSDPEEWNQFVQDNPLEKEHIYSLMRRMASKFMEEPTRDPDFIREVVHIGPLLDKDLHRKLVMAFLQELQRCPMLDVNILLGLSQLIQDMPPGSLSFDDLIRIVKSARRRLEETAGKDVEGTIYLTFAITIILTTLATYLPRNQGRVEYVPLLKVLSTLEKHKDPLIKFQARYGKRLLLSTFGQHSADCEPNSTRGTRGLLKLLRISLESYNQKQWVQDVQNAKGFLQSRHFSDFYRLLREGPSIGNTDFQWHVCQLLGEISMDLSWDDSARQQSLALLHEYAKGNGAVKSEPVVRRLALTILRHISENSVTFAGTFNTRNIHSAAIMEKKKGGIFSLRARSTKHFELVHPLASRLPLPMTSPLLYKVNTDADVELAIDRLLRQQSRRYLVTAEHDGCVRRWDAETGTSQIILNTTSGLVQQVSYFSDGQKLAITKEMRTVIYDTSDEIWRPVEELEGEYPVKYSPCGSRMALGTDQGAIKLRNLLPNVGGEQQLLKGPTTRSQKLVFSKSGGWLASISDRDVWIWDMAQVNLSPRIYRKNRLPVDIAFSPCGNTLAIVYISGVSLVNVKTLGERTSLEEETHFCRIAWSNCGHRIIGSSVNSIVLWATDSKEWGLKLLTVEATPALYVAWSPTTPMEVAISVGRSVSVWRIEEQGKRIRFCLVWGSFPNSLVAKKADITRAIGLKLAHRKLLVQRGAIDKFGAIVNGILDFTSSARSNK